MIGKNEIRVNFFFESDGVRCRAKWRNDNVTESFSIRLDCKVDGSKWNKESMRCKPNSFHFGVSALEINKSIDRYESLIREVFNRYVALGVLPTSKAFRNEFRIAIGRDSAEQHKQAVPTICEVFDKFLQSERPKWAVNTYLKFVTLRKFISTWYPNAVMSDVDKHFYEEFINRYISMGYKNSSTKKNVNLFKWFVHWAKDNELADSSVQDKIKHKFKGTDENFNTIVYLTWDELLFLYNFDFGEKFALEQVRDVFCFCCFTSLRYSDVKNLQWYDVYDSYIKIVTQKTSEPLKIELNNYSSAILNKYKDKTGISNQSSALPVLSNARMNRLIKEMARLVGFNDYIRKVFFIGNQRKEIIKQKWELLTTHCGRKTFIVNAIYLGIPTEVVMKWTGHSDYKSMKPYIAISDKLKEQSMSLFNRK